MNFNRTSILNIKKDIFELQENEQSNQQLYVVETKEKLYEQHVIQSSQQVYVLVKPYAQCLLKIVDRPLSQAVIDYTILVENHAQCNIQVIVSEIQNLSININVYLGDYSKVVIKGLYALNNEQKITMNTYQYHQGIHSKSDLVIKGMLKDSAQAYYKGLIKIDKGASKTQASQENKNILLNKKAQVVSVPSIEVLQHDVQCCHGSAIGKFDQEQLWYLQSKGLQKRKAYELLTRSFFQSVVDDTNYGYMEQICQKMI